MNEPQRKNVSPKYAHEFLKLINDGDKETQLKILKEQGSKSPLNMLLSLNFDSNIKLDLPEGMPPVIKRDDTVHEDLFAPLGAQIVRLKHCLTTNNIPKFKKEQVFIQVLEAVSSKEAEVLVACKDKSLHELYPNVTADLVKEVFPNYVR